IEKNNIVPELPCALHLQFCGSAAAFAERKDVERALLIILYFRFNSKAKASGRLCVDLIVSHSLSDKKDFDMMCL
ncbi:MAG: hypothetical protein PUG24_00005, partial [Eubacteriales bacterium]|nr:hypothetical protein [Eubacteriales bacterium]